MCTGLCVCSSFLFPIHTGALDYVRQFVELGNRKEWERHTVQYVWKLREATGDDGGPIDIDNLQQQQRGKISAVVALHYIHSQNERNYCTRRQTHTFIYFFFRRSVWVRERICVCLCHCSCLNVCCVERRMRSYSHNQPNTKWIAKINGVRIANHDIEYDEGSRSKSKTRRQIVWVCVEIQ